MPYPNRFPVPQSKYVKSYGDNLNFIKIKIIKNKYYLCLHNFNLWVGS